MGGVWVGYGWGMGGVWVRYGWGMGAVWVGYGWDGGAYEVGGGVDEGGCRWKGGGGGQMEGPPVKCSERLTIAGSSSSVPCAARSFRSPRRSM